MLKKSKIYIFVMVAALFVFILKNYNDSRWIQKSSKGNIYIPKKDYNCIITLESRIDRDREGNFVIPSKEVLSKFPKHLIDCLYHRYTTTLQTFCAKRSRHGSLSHGWNLCIDGCFRPNNDSHFYVISAINEFDSDASIKKTYGSKLRRYMPKNETGLKEKFDLIQINTTDGKEMQNEFSLKEAAKQIINKEGVILIDVGNFTESVVKYILENDILRYIQQLSIFTSYGGKMKIDYITVLEQLRQLYNNGFRIYWSRMERKCILNNNGNRTSCVQLDMVYQGCRNVSKTAEHEHIVLPNNTALSTMSEPEVENLYHGYLTSTQIYCKEIVRLGGIRDGGWDICNDRKYRPGHPCLVYSFGINWDFRFDDAIADTYGCEVHSFDPSMKTKDFRRSDRVWFHDLGIWNKTNYYDKDRKWKVSTLKDIREDLNHTSRKIDVLKMDVESSEWFALPDMVKSGALSDVTQAYFEFHSPGNIKHLGTVRLLYDEGFRIFWNHRNPACVLNRTTIQYTHCNEVYLLKTK